MAMVDELGRPFGALLRAAFISNLGDGLRLAALPLLAASLTSSPALVAGLTAAQYLPWIGWAPVAGLIVDRADRRRLIITTQIWRAVVMCGLGVAVITDQAEMWHLFVVAFVITAGEIVVDPAVVALVPMLVTDADLDRANGRLVTVETATNDFAGKTLGAIVFGFAPWLPFVADGVTYAGSVRYFAELPTRSPDHRPAHAEPVRAALGAGLRWIRTHSFLRPWTLAWAVFHLGTGGTIAVLVLFVKNTLDQSAWVYGVVLAAASVGATVAAFVAADLAERFGRRLAVSGACAVVGVTVAAAAVVDAAWQLTVVWVLNGAAFAVSQSVGRGFLQRNTPNDLLGRTAVASRMITRGTFVLGALAIGAAAERAGLRWGLGLAACFHLVGSAQMWLSFRTHAEV